MASNRLNISVGIHQPQSRAGLITSATLPEASEIGIKLEGYDDADNIKFTAATQDSKQVWNPASDIVLDETKGTLYAYYPWKSGTNLSAIPVETASQTDFLYAEPVANVSEKNANVPVTMKHMLANVKIAINKGTYVGTGNVSKIAIQSDGFATGGTFNAAQETPAYTATTGAGTAIESNAATTLGGNATDIMVVPTGVAKPITFTATIDDVDYTVTSSDVTLQNGNSYEYTLSLNSTFLAVSEVTVTPWNDVTKENLTLNKVEGVQGSIDLKTAPNGVYAVAKNGLGVTVEDADETCVGVALIVNDAPTPQRIMIAKMDATNNGSNYKLYWLYSADNLFVLTDYTTVTGTNSYGCLPKPDGTYGNLTHLSDNYTTWTAGALSDFNGKANTNIIIKNSTDVKDMGKVLKTFNEGTNSQSNEGFNDWYVPSCGQLGLIYLARTDLDAALAKIGGEAFVNSSYWSSSENTYYAWYVGFGSGDVDGSGDSSTSHKDYANRVRFVRDI